MNAHRHLKIICSDPELELDEHRPNIMPKTVYRLGKEQKMRKLIPIAFHEMLPKHVWRPVQYRWMYLFERASGSTKKIWLSEPERHIIKTYILTNCEVVTPYYDWVDPVRGIKVHPTYHLVDVNFKKLYQKDDPFILAQQAVQVYFTEYPNMKRDKADWMTVCKIKVRRVIDGS
ncbi:hypothetical protein Sango_2407600 [Sesamum angolense]|uniref:DUF4216 domain-containing protein n=1 Tax=Sesamum angolense TaxID=2727404 RepID=A0AAE2BJT9_9LAMI|nr:hypothetical protein Sango_2407600 [Sesamum angolense]